MSRQRYQLTEKQLKELQESYHNSKDAKVRTRWQAVRLYGQGRTVNEIMEITGCSRTSLGEWWAKYRQQGVAGLTDHRLGGNSAKLTAKQLTDLKQRLEQYTPQQLFGQECISPDGQNWSIGDLHQAVEKWYGIRYKSLSSYRELFKRCGFSYQRPAKIYRSRSEQKVAQFEAELEKKSSISLWTSLKQ